MERRLVSAASFHMAIDRIVAGVDPRVGEPAAVDARLRIENALRPA